MAKMHSRARGKSGSTKPLKRVPAWTPYTGADVEKLIVKYAKVGKSTSEIGLLLRDAHGVGSVKASTGKKVSGIIQEKGLMKEMPEDLRNLIKKIVYIQRHLEKNKQDETAKHGLLLTNSKIRRLVKYYQRTQRLPTDWKLDMDRLKIYLE